MNETREYLVEPYMEGINPTVTECRSGVKITHLPTGLSEIATEERNQLRNREAAFKRLVKRVEAGS